MHNNVNLDDEAMDEQTTKLQIKQAMKLDKEWVMKLHKEQKMKPPKAECQSYSSRCWSCPKERWTKQFEKQALKVQKEESAMNMLDFQKEQKRMVVLLVWFPLFLIPNLL